MDTMLIIRQSSVKFLLSTNKAVNNITFALSWYFIYIGGQLFSLFSK